MVFIHGSPFFISKEPVIRSIIICFNTFWGNHALHLPYLLLLHPVTGWNFSWTFLESPWSLLYFLLYSFGPPLHVCIFDYVIHCIMETYPPLFQIITIDARSTFQSMSTIWRWRYRERFSWIDIFMLYYIITNILLYATMQAHHKLSNMSTFQIFYYTFLKGRVFIHNSISYFLWCQWVHYPNDHM